MNAPASPAVLNIQQWNPGAPRRVLLAHGLASSSGTWWSVASGLAAHGLQVVAPDLRGHGASPRTASYRFDEHQSDLELVGGTWDLAIGHSLAGPILAGLALAGTLEKLILLDPVFEIPDEDFDALVADQLSELGPAIAAEDIAAANPRWHYQDCFQKAVDARTTSPHVVEQCLRDNFEYHHLGDLAAIDVPTLILGADPAIGTMCPAAHIDPTTMPTAEHIVVDGAGHGIHREQAEHVTSVALEFLQD